MADDKIIIEILLDDGTVRKGFLNIERQAESSGENINKSLKDSNTGLKDMAKGAGLVVAAFVGFRAVTSIINTFSDSIAKAAEQQQAIQSLNTSLASAGGFSAEASRHFQDLAKALQDTTIYGDEVILQQLALARNFTNTNEQAEKLIRAAVDLSSQAGLSLESSVRNLGKTFSGLTGELGESVKEVRGLTAEQLKLGAALDVVGKRFLGAAEAAARTARGAYLQTKNAIGDTLEEIGKIVTQSPAVAAAIGVVAGGFKQLSTAISSGIDGQDLFKEILSNAVTFAAFLTASLGPLLEASYRVGSIFFNSLITGTKAALTAIAGVGALIEKTINYIFNTNSTAFAEITSSLASSTAESANDTADAFSNAFTKTGEVTNTALDFMSQLKGAIDATNGKLNELADDGLKNASETVDKAAEKVGKYRDALVNGLGQIASGAIQNLTKQLIKGKLSLESFGNYILSAMGDIAIQVGTMMITTGIGMLALKALDPTGSIAAGAGLVAIGTIMKAIGGNEDTGVDVGAGAGGVPTSPAFQDSVGPDEIEERVPTTQLAINIQGDVLDSDDTGLRIVEHIKKYADRNGPVEVLA